uniref:Putative secreted protein n=1 Tax=Anopheles triannulatus TaxID=58253 RepID=A0A2M4B7M5_9DIPT
MRQFWHSGPYSLALSVISLITSHCPPYHVVQEHHMREHGGDGGTVPTDRRGSWVCDRPRRHGNSTEGMLK